MSCQSHSESLGGAENLPVIIQGGMGVGVSGWRLARGVSECGQLGVVSGTALDLVLTRQLQLGDVGGHLRRALEAFPFPKIAERVYDRYFIEGGKADETPFRTCAMISHEPSRATVELVIVSNFVAIHLAKEGHDGVVGINLLEKIQTPTLMALYGAMLAGVDVVLMGAGVPRQIPKILDDFSAGQVARMRLDVKGATEPVFMELDPHHLGESRSLKRPLFLPVVSSHVLAENLRRKASGRVDGFVVEGPIAGGHNAPPRGSPVRSERGEPVYGDKDMIQPEKFVDIGLPFWLAGGYGKAGKLRDAQALGARGIQVGTAFAFCEESGFDVKVKEQVLDEILADELEVFTDPNASPTGFPIKIAELEGTVADPEIYADRLRVCDLGVLRESYQSEDGSVAFRCPAECVDSYVRKGGDAKATKGRMCLCNGLLAAAGLAQLRNGVAEPPLVTMGGDLEAIRELASDGQKLYKARDVINRLLS